MNKTPAIGLYSFLLITLAASCVNLEHINTFATASVKSLNSQQSTGYSFTQSCLDFDCRPDIYSYPATDNDLPAAFGPAPACDCDAFKKADKALNTLNGVVTAYLTGLGNLSDGKAVNYNYGDLVNAVDSNALLSKLSISSAEWTSVGKIATIVSNDLMNAYRKKKLKDIIKKTDPAFQIVISAYIKGMQRFEKSLLQDDLLWLMDKYSTYLKAHRDRLSPYEAGQVYAAYLSERAKILTYKSINETFITALQKIADGHAALAKEADHLTEDTIKQLINQYSADISALLTELSTFKK
jgi:hypothetical protein